MPEFKINKAIDYNVEMFSLLSFLLVLISIAQNVKKYIDTNSDCFCSKTFKKTKIYILSIGPL